MQDDTGLVKKKDYNKFTKETLDAKIKQKK